MPIFILLVCAGMLFESAFSLSVSLNILVLEPGAFHSKSQNSVTITTSLFKQKLRLYYNWQQQYQGTAVFT